MNPEELKRLLTWLQSNPDIMKQYQEGQTLQNNGAQSISTVPTEPSNYLDVAPPVGTVSVPIGISGGRSSTGVPEIMYSNVPLGKNKSSGANMQQNFPQDFFSADYNNDGIPDYLQDTNFGKKEPEKTTGTARKNMPAFPLIYPGAIDVNQEVYSLGRALGAPKGERGRGATIVGSAGAATLGIASDLISGLGYEKINSYITDWYQDQQSNNNYTPNPQTRNTNILGRGEYGGIFEDGGFAPEGEAQNQQEQPQDQMVMLQQAVAQMLQEGTPPEEVVQALVQQGLPQEQATQLVQAVLSQYQAQESQQAFNKNVGDEVSFKYGGKKLTGTIKKIEGGKFYI